MKSSAITAVGIDVSKNKSMVAVRRPEEKLSCIRLRSVIQAMI